MGRIFLALAFTLSSLTSWANESESQIDKVVRLSAEYTKLSDQLEEAKSAKNKQAISFVVSTSAALGLGLLGYRLQNTPGRGEYGAIGNMIGAWASYGGAVVAVGVSGYSGYRVFVKDPRVISKLSEDVKAKLAELEEAKKVELLNQEAQ